MAATVWTFAMEETILWKTVAYDFVASDRGRSPPESAPANLLPASSLIFKQSIEEGICTGIFSKTTTYPLRVACSLSELCR